MTCWWRIDLPYWFKVIFLLKISRILTMLVKKINFTHMRPQAQLNLVYVRWVYARCDWWATKVTIHSLILLSGKLKSCFYSGNNIDHTGWLHCPDLFLQQISSVSICWTIFLAMLLFPDDEFPWICDDPLPRWPPPPPRARTRRYSFNIAEDWASSCAIPEFLDCFLWFTVTFLWWRSLAITQLPTALMI